MLSTVLRAPRGWERCPQPGPQRRGAACPPCKVGTAACFCPAALHQPFGPCTAWFFSSLGRRGGRESFKWEDAVGD